VSVHDPRVWVHVVGEVAEQRVLFRETGECTPQLSKSFFVVSDRCEALLRHVVQHLVLLVHSAQLGLSLLQLFVHLAHATALVVCASFVQIEDPLLLPKLLELTLRFVHLSNQGSVGALQLLYDFFEGLHLRACQLVALHLNLLGLHLFVTRLKLAGLFEFLDQHVVLVFQAAHLTVIRLKNVFELGFGLEGAQSLHCPFQFHLKIGDLQLVLQSELFNINRVGLLEELDFLKQAANVRLLLFNDLGCFRLNVRSQPLQVFELLLRD